MVLVDPCEMVMDHRLKITVLDKEIKEWNSVEKLDAIRTAANIVGISWGEMYNKLKRNGSYYVIFITSKMPLNNTG